MNIYLRIKNRIPNSFLYSTLVRLIITLIRQNFNKIDKEKISFFNNYLKLLDVPSIEYILNVLYNNIVVVKKHNDIYEIKVDPSVRIGNYKLNTLIRLIEYGNLEIRGLNFIEDTFDYIKKNIDYLILAYAVGGLK